MNGHVAKDDCCIRCVGSALKHYFEQYPIYKVGMHCVTEAHGGGTTSCLTKVGLKNLRGFVQQQQEYSESL